MNLRAHRSEAIWAGAAVASIACIPLLAERIWIFALAPVALVLFVGIALAGYWTFSKQGQRAAILLGLIVLLGVLAGPLQGLIASARTNARFRLERDELDAIVARELASLRPRAFDPAGGAPQSTQT